jgi:hypothetical protein
MTSTSLYSTQLANASTARLPLWLVIVNQRQQHRPVYAGVRVTGNKLFLRTRKRGLPVYLPPPVFMLTAIKAVPKISEQVCDEEKRGSIGRAPGV